MAIVTTSLCETINVSLAATVNHSLVDDMLNEMSSGPTCTFSRSYDPDGVNGCFVGPPRTQRQDSSMVRHYYKINFSYIYYDRGLGGMRKPAKGLVTVPHANLFCRNAI